MVSKGAAGRLWGLLGFARPLVVIEPSCNPANVDVKDRISKLCMEVEFRERVFESLIINARGARDGPSEDLAALLTLKYVE